jgi:hypothetical protein
MATIRTSNVLPGGGTVTLPGYALRKGLKFRNAGAAAMTLNGADGWVAPVAAGATYQEMPANPELVMQGPLTITGTAGQAYDLIEYVR